MGDDSELLPCPFCKSADVKAEFIPWVEGEMCDQFFVECQDCGARGPDISHWVRNDEERFLSDARRMWNKHSILLSQPPDRWVSDIWTECGRCEAIFPTRSSCANH